MPRIATPLLLDGFDPLNSTIVAPTDACARTSLQTSSLRTHTHSGCAVEFIDSPNTQCLRVTASSPPRARTHAHTQAGAPRGTRAIDRKRAFSRARRTAAVRFQCACQA